MTPIMLQHAAPGLLYAYGPPTSNPTPGASHHAGVCRTLLTHIHISVMVICCRSRPRRANPLPQVLPIMLECARSDHADLRQCAVYGLGVMAARAPADAFRPHAAQIAELLAAIIQHPDAK